MPKAGYRFAPIRVQGFQRSITPRNLARNVNAIWLLTRSGRRARQILAEFQPDLVMGTGGYVSGPVLRTAHKLGYKTLAHEQNAYPGVTTRLLARQADRVLLAVEGAKKHLPEGIDYRVTGNPVRESILHTDRVLARQVLGVGERLCILSFGGSLGAPKINEAVAALMAWHKGKRGVHHIHATGAGGAAEFPELLAKNGLDPAGNPHIDIREYIDDMPRCLAGADLVICRAGAITLSELQAVGRAAILIPSPYVAENHQYHNAMELVGRGGALILEEKKLTGDALIALVEPLIENPARLAEIGRQSAQMAITDANERILAEIIALLDQK